MVANPFHSDKVKGEIALRNQRPSALDEDDTRIMGNRDRTPGGEWFGDNGAEPNYGEAFGSHEGAGPQEGTRGPRVARVETSAGTGGVVGVIRTW